MVGCMGKPNSGSCLEGCGSWAAPALLHFTHSLLYFVGRMECERISIVYNVELAAVRPCGGVVLRGALRQACVVRRLFIL